MKSIFTILILLFTYTAISQDLNTINPELTRKTWVDGETRAINGYQVTCVENTDYGNRRNSTTGMITSVALAENNKLEFYITRYEQSIANLKWFMIIIRGEDDKEKIFEQKLEYQAPELPEGNYYWNYTTIELPQNIHPPFYVYIRDRNIQMLYSSKFFIEK